MLHKTYSLLDAKADGETGSFEATVAVFGNVDRGGDRIMPGAFKDTLAKWQASGDPIPVILSHQWDNPMAHIGVVNDAKETDKGLWVKGTLDVADNDVARQVHKLMKRRSLKEFSFGYEVAKGGQKRAKDGANDLTALDLAEVGPTLKGMNPATELHAVKSALDEKASPASMAAQMRAMADEMASANPPDPAAMAARMRRMADQMMSMSANSGEPDTKNTELQEVKAMLERLEQRFEDLGQKAEETDKQPDKAGSVDTLRKTADDLELQFASNGLSLEKPPAPVAPQPRTDLVDLDDLKRRMRDDMLIHLNGDIE